MEATSKVLEQIAHLIAKIQDPGVTEEEREMCRERADRLMLRHAIDEAQLAQMAAGSARTKPASSEVIVSPYFDPWRNDLAGLLMTLAEGNRCRVFVAQQREGRNGSDWQYIGHIVGFEADVRFVEMMYTSIHLTFASKINPRWDNSRSEGENVRTLKEAGWKWQDIARAGEFDWPDGGLLKRIYLRQLKADGATEQRVTTQRHGAYRHSFAEAFFSRLTTRLWALQRSHESQIKEYEAETGNTGTALILGDRSHEVDEAFYEKFPALRPESREDIAKRREARLAAEAEAAAKALQEREDMLAAMTPAARDRFLAKEEREYEKARRKEEREDRQWRRARDRQEEREYDPAGRAAGRIAADSIDLTGGRGSVGGGSRKQIG